MKYMFNIKFISEKKIGEKKNLVRTFFFLM